MCHDGDSHPPVEGRPSALAGQEDMTLVAADGNRLAAHLALAKEKLGPGVVILPDVRGLYHFYEELAVRFAEHGYDALAIDYFGRTAGVGKRDDEFPYREHVPLTTPEGVAADTRAAVERLREDSRERPIFTVGFCFGGSNSWNQAAEGHRLAGAIGFYGNPKRPPLAPIDQVDDFECPILGLMGGEDPSIPVEVVDEYRRALSDAGVDAELIVYPGAPHSFFDRKQAEYSDAASDAWSRALAFMSRNS
jgi:carboxymethylenebutenolidase